MREMRIFRRQRCGMAKSETNKCRQARTYICASGFFCRFAKRFGLICALVLDAFWWRTVSFCHYYLYAAGGAGCGQAADKGKCVRYLLDSSRVYGRYSMDTLAHATNSCAEQQSGYSISGICLGWEAGRFMSTLCYMSRKIF